MESVMQRPQFSEKSTELLLLDGNQKSHSQPPGMYKKKTVNNIYHISINSRGEGSTNI